jgi:hypothetical protein
VRGELQGAYADPSRLHAVAVAPLVEKPNVAEVDGEGFAGCWVSAAVTLPTEPGAACLAGAAVAGSAVLSVRSVRAAAWGRSRGYCTPVPSAARYASFEPAAGRADV